MLQRFHSFSIRSAAPLAAILLTSCAIRHEEPLQSHAPIVAGFGDVQVTWVSATGTDFVGIARPRPRRDDMTITELGQWLSDDRSIVWIIGGWSGSFPIEDDEFIMPVYSKATEQIITIHRSDIHARDVRGGTTKRIWSNDGYMLGRAGVTTNDDGTLITTTAYNLEDESEGILSCRSSESGQSLFTLHRTVPDGLDDIVCVCGETAFSVHHGQAVVYEINRSGTGIWERYHTSGGDSKQPPWSTENARLTIVGAGDRGPILYLLIEDKQLPTWRDPHAIWMAGRWMETKANTFPIHARSHGGRTWIIADSTIRCVETGQCQRVEDSVGSGITDRGVWIVDSDFVLWRGQGDELTSTHLPIKLGK
ncbi:MAG: hypothetical protein IT430_01565 [Phycisphaerales bacterium]|nr:hypothetical protein [Phycisphaerales bacterium]